MLGYWRPHKEYMHFVLSELKTLAQSSPGSVREYAVPIRKLLMLNLDKLEKIMAPLYPPLGRHAEWQPEIYRSFILMVHLNIPLNNWINKLINNPILCLIAGFPQGVLPKTSSYYDFIDRLIDMDERSAKKPIMPKPKKKLKKGEKLPPKNPGITLKLAKSLISDEKRFLRRLSNRPERFLQKIFADVCVAQSIERGLVSEDVDISGDGTCIETGASIYGRKVCQCRENGVYRCDCDRLFSDLSATWGWDSHCERYFYGYTGYFISTYNKAMKTDLPLYLRLVQASRHDSVSALFALSEFRELYPKLHINSFISDSASDNYGTYQLLHHWNINAIIALNPKNEGNTQYPTALSIDDHGAPVCPGGRSMIYNGFCKDRSRHKWRCPRVVRKLDPCAACTSCSPSPYGRVIYTKPDWDLRLFTRIPRASDPWKNLMKQRTAAERVNNRILNDYGIERARTEVKNASLSLSLWPLLMSILMRG